MPRKRVKSGYTIIEVTLFLALTVALFSPLIIGTSSNIARQRYQDSVNDVYSYLQNIYSGTENIVNSNSGNVGSRADCTIAAQLAAAENTNNKVDKPLANTDKGVGRTNCAIYGHVYFFERSNDSSSEANGIGTTTIKSYDVIGDVLNISKTDDNELDFNNKPLDLISALRAVHADYISCESGTVVASGQVDSHTFPWDSSLQTTGTKDAEDRTTNIEPFEGALLVVRSPLNGAISSLFIDTSNLETDQDNIVTNEQDVLGKSCTNTATIEKASLYSYLGDSSDPKFSYGNTYNLCVASPDIFAYGGASSNRRNIQIKTAMPASSRDVSLLNMDDGENQCR